MVTRVASAVLVADDVVLDEPASVGGANAGFGCLDCRTRARHASPAIAPAVTWKQFGSVGVVK